jgi:hypothetical protein
VPVVVPLLELGAFVIVLWVIGIALIIAVVMGYVAGVLHGLPFPLNQLAGPVEKLAKGISNACYAAIHKSEQLLGASFHLLARYTDKLWSEIRRHAVATLEAATIIGTIVSVVHLLRKLVHQLTNGHHVVSQAIKTLEHEYSHLRHRVKAIEEQLARGIGHDLRTRIKALEKEYTGLKDRVIPDLRAGIKAAEGEVADLKNFLKVVPGTKYLDWVAAIGLAALASLGLDFLKCDNAKNMSKNRGCSTWSALDDLLGLLALGIVAEDFEQLVHEAQDLTEGAVTVFDDVFGLSR